MLSGLNYSKSSIISFVQEKLSLNYTLWVKYKPDLLTLPSIFLDACARDEGLA